MKEIAETAFDRAAELARTSGAESIEAAADGLTPPRFGDGSCRPSPSRISYSARAAKFRGAIQSREGSAR